MMQFNTSELRGALSLGGLKSVIPALALAAGLATASAGHAESIFLQSATMNTSYTAHIYSPPYPSAGYTDQYVYLAPMQFTAYDGVGPVGDSNNLLAFCVDIFHHIGLGAVNLQYDDTQPFTSDSASPSTALTGAQKVQVGRLVNYGSLLFGSGATDEAAKLAGLQGAIWQVINPTYTITSFNGLVDGYMASYANALTYNAAIGDLGPVSSKITFITETGKYGASGAHQSFAFAAAPEPGTWALMILGFGGAGAMLRRSRRMIAANA